MDLIKRAKELGFEVEIHPRSTIFLKFKTNKDTYAIYHFNSMWEFEAFLDGFSLAVQMIAQGEVNQEG